MVTQKDVAKKAGVSSATVSAVLNKNKFVSKDLKVKVQKAIIDLNYEINSIARSLKSNRSYTIGVIIGNVLSYFYSVIARSIEQNAKKYGYSIILCNGDDNPEEELKYLKVLKSNRVDGIILTPTGKNSKYIKQIIETGSKIVLIDRLIDGVECDTVLIDNVNSAYNAVKHLIENGYRRIALINGFIDRTTGKGRMEGYLKALDEYGIPRNNDLIKIGTFKEESGIQLSRELLEHVNKPDAIFSANIDITLGLWKTVKEMGLKIPEDIAIVGFDDSQWATIVEPPLTCVNQPTSKFGKEAVDLLVKKIEKNNNKNNIPKIITLETSLSIRGSSIKKKK